MPSWEILCHKISKDIYIEPDKSNTVNINTTTVAIMQPIAYILDHRFLQNVAIAVELNNNNISNG